MTIVWPSPDLRVSPGILGRKSWTDLLIFFLSVKGINLIRHMRYFSILFNAKSFHLYHEQMEVMLWPLPSDRIIPLVSFGLESWEFHKLTWKKNLRCILTVSHFNLFRKSFVNALYHPYCVMRHSSIRIGMKKAEWGKLKWLTTITPESEANKSWCKFDLKQKYTIVRVISESKKGS